MGVHHLSGIQEGDKENEEDGKEKSIERTEEAEEPKESLPWKIARDDDPVRYSEEWSSASDTPVFSDRDHAEKSDTPEDNSEEAHTKRGGVMFTVGPEDREEDVHDDKKNHRKVSGSRKKDRHHPEVSLEMRRRPGSELQVSENVLHEDDDENLKEGDLEEMAGHRFEK